MKKFCGLAVVTMLTMFSFATMVAAFPTLPEDIQIIQSDPALPQELTAFLGRWERKANGMEFYMIVAKIEQNKATVYLCSSSYGWNKVVGETFKEYGKWKIWFPGRAGNNTLSLRKLNILDLDVPPATSVAFEKVP